jgi:hypothetical protein
MLKEQQTTAKKRGGILNFKGAQESVSGIDFASIYIYSLVGRNNPIPTRFLAPVDYFKIPALYKGIPTYVHSLCRKTME